MPKSQKRGPHCPNQIRPNPLVKSESWSRSVPDLADDVSEPVPGVLTIHLRQGPLEPTPGPNSGPEIRLRSVRTANRLSIDFCPVFVRTWNRRCGVFQIVPGIGCQNVAHVCHLPVSMFFWNASTTVLGGVCTALAILCRSSLHLRLSE